MKADEKRRALVAVRLAKRRDAARRAVAPAMGTPARRREAAKHSRERVKRILRDVFRKEFPEDTVDVSDGYAGNIHVTVVSRKFDRVSERKRQDWLWQIVESTDLTEAEKRLISLLYPVSVAEI